MSESLTITTEKRQVFYPESDGKPMAETEVHLDAVIYVQEALRDYFRNAPDIYVASNMLLYYEEGNPTACVAPDVFIVKGITKQERRIYIADFICVRPGSAGVPPAQKATETVALPGKKVAFICKPL